MDFFCFKCLLKLGAYGPTQIKSKYLACIGVCRMQNTANNVGEAPTDILERGEGELSIFFLQVGLIFSTTTILLTCSL